MLRSVEGVFRDGKVELVEIPTNIGEDTPVIVTFLTSPYVDLSSRGIDRRKALELRDRLAPFAEEWDSPDMDAYDRYDEAKSNPR